ncbi:MAG TPA: hypothetical protein VFX28_24775 [Methylomirabilota bacterium]|nr:hypothetical protein [Methylomirabilota bacterium]
MAERRLPIGLIAIVPVIAGFAVWAFTGQQPVADPDATPTASSQATATPASAATPPSPPAATPPSPPAAPAPVEPEATPTQALTSHGDFHEGAWVRVDAGAGDCLNARSRPSLEPEYNIVNICLPDGYEGYLDGAAQQADGHFWWFMAGMGWVAEDYLRYVRDVSLREPMAPALAGKGRIAFVRGADVWLMEADGSGQRVLLDRDDDEQASIADGLSWSPDGTMIAFNVQRWGAAEQGVTLHVVALDGREALVAPGVAGGGWSHDGRRIGMGKDAIYDGMGGGYEGIPGWLDVTTGELHAFGSERSWQQSPPAFSPDSALLLGTYAKFDGGDGRRSIVLWTPDGAEHRRIDMPDDTYYGSPAWSPHGLIAFHVSAGDRPHYAVYDIASGGIVDEAPVPRASPNIGGRCGGANMWRLEWSRDGRSIHYSYGMGDTGANGAWTWDLDTGQQRVAPAMGASSVSAGPEGLIAFSAAGARRSMIFVAPGDGGMPALITEGSAPAWQPAP